MTSSTPSVSGADKALTRSAALWLAVSLIGQWAFFAYIAAFYGPSTLQGDFQAWTRNKMLITGYVAGDAAGNLAFGAHVLLAAVVSLGGTLQLIPWIRARAPALHRWTGRVFLLTAIAASVSGLYMVWVRGTRLDNISAIAISLDAALIISFAVLAWRTAMARDFVRHRPWALRTFLVANGQWFFRIGFIPWMIASHALGGGKALNGAFMIVWAFGCYLLPLAVLELYLRAKARGGPAARLVVAGLLLVITALMAVGVIGVALFMWAPTLATLQASAHA